MVCLINWSHWREWNFMWTHFMHVLLVFREYNNNNNTNKKWASKKWVVSRCRALSISYHVNNFIVTVPHGKNDRNCRLFVKKKELYLKMEIFLFETEYWFQLFIVTIINIIHDFKKISDFDARFKASALLS